MCNFSCVLSNEMIELCDIDLDVRTQISKQEFEKKFNRRQRGKWPISVWLAAGLWTHYDFSDRLKSLGSTTSQIPLLILNRYANWDYVDGMLHSSIAATIEAINSYVATAWFPASLQGYLTIEYKNHAQALTLATKDIVVQAAAVNSLFLKDSSQTKTGVVVVGTFETIPLGVIDHQLSNSRPIAFGALSIISSQDNREKILSVLSKHQELYDYVKSS